MVFISRAMSTQHPDNVNIPFFADHPVIGGDDEIKEAFYAFSHLNCDEQLWDCEGKEVDNFVVKKMLTNYEPYFRRKKLGVDKILTFRVPNPSVEKNEGKILIEALNSIPRSFDVSRIFYGEDVVPVFEAFVPMVSTSKDIIRVAEYYKQYVAGKSDKFLVKNDASISDWLGRFYPEKIRVAPIVEDMKSMLAVDQITKEYIESQKIKEFQRVWLARSDPALNYGSLATVLLEKIALQKLHHLEEESSIEIYPILGCGSAPFRGNFKPDNVERNMRGYPSIHTFTLQSAFKYDYPVKKVIEGIDILNNTKRKKPLDVDEEACMKIINKLADEYTKQVTILAPFVNKITPFIHQRRKRKLHIGLFGYSRGKGISLPRAIPFCASLYSFGLPPDLLGLNAITQKDVEILSDYYPGFQSDYEDAMSLFNPDNLHIFPQEIQDAVKKSLSLFPYMIDEKHQKITSIIAEDYKKGNTEVMKENILRAGYIRQFLG
jgi:phosphoenolpyruvate carboxylase